jgi:hypothetical protein
MNKITELTDEQLVQFAKELTPGTKVLAVTDDPDNPDQIGIIVKPTAEELAYAKENLCGFDDDDVPCYTLVAWSWSDEPNEVFGRYWEALDDLQKVED